MIDETLRTGRKFDLFGGWHYFRLFLTTARGLFFPEAADEFGTAIGLSDGERALDDPLVLRFICSMRFFLDRIDGILSREYSLSR